MRADADERLRNAIAIANTKRGRPLTDREKLDNLARWLDYNLDEDGLDPIQALVADAAAEEPRPMLHEAGEYYAERVIRRAIAQGALILVASVDTRPEGGDATEIAAPFTSGAVPSETSADAQTPSGSSPHISEDLL